MMKRVRIVAVGAWHTHAKDFAARLVNLAGAELVGVYDSDPAAADQWAWEARCRCFADFGQVLEDKEIDGVLITCPTVFHEKYIKEALQFGKNVFVEKAIATTAAEAREIRDEALVAQRRYGTRLVVSDPVQKGEVLYAKRLIEEGRFGTLLSVRVRRGHDLALRAPKMVEQYLLPEESGGGVLLDMGYHAVHILHFLLGQPVDATAQFRTLTDISRRTSAEDYCSVTYRYADTTIGVAESGLVFPRFSNGLEIIGTEGYMSSFTQGRICCQFRDDDSYEVDSANLPEKWPDPLAYWVRCIQENCPCVRYQAGEAVEVMEMIELAYHKARDYNLKMRNSSKLADFVAQQGEKLNG